MRKGKILALILLGLLFFSSVSSTGLKINSNENNPVEYWGIILDDSGGGNGILSYWKEILCTHGWQEDHINLVIEQNLTKQKVIDTITWLDEHEDSNDISLIFIAAHGTPGFFHLSDGRMSYWRLNREINKLESRGMFILLFPCYSGSAIPFLKKRGRVIITSCRATEVSIGLEGSVGFGLSGIGDNIGDDNGMVSAEELYRYIAKIPLASDIHPQISDKYPGDLNLVSVHPDDRRIDQKQILYDIEAFPDLKVGQEYFIAQSFIPNSSTLTKIKLGINRWPSFTYPIKVSVKKDLLGENLTWTYVDGYQIPEDPWVLTEFDFPDVNVIPGEKYYIVCSTTEIYNFTRISLRAETQDVYTNGALYISKDSGKTWSYDEEYKDLFFIIYDDKNLNPELTIKNPQKALYINNKKILPFFRPIIIGDINIEVEVTDPDGDRISYVEFYVDDEWKNHDTNPSYNWTWDERTPLKFRHTIKIIAYDNVGKSATEEIKVWKLF